MASKNFGKKISSKGSNKNAFKKSNSQNKKKSTSSNKKKTNGFKPSAQFMKNLTKSAGGAAFNLLLGDDLGGIFSEASSTAKELKTEYGDLFKAGKTGKGNLVSKLLENETGKMVADLASTAKKGLISDLKSGKIFGDYEAMDRLMMEQMGMGDDMDDFDDSFDDDDMGFDMDDDFDSSSESFETGDISFDMSTTNENEFVDNRIKYNKVTNITNLASNKVLSGMTASLVGGLSGLSSQMEAMATASSEFYQSNDEFKSHITEKIDSIEEILRNKFAKEDKTESTFIEKLTSYDLLSNGILNPIKMVQVAIESVKNKSKNNDFLDMNEIIKPMLASPIASVIGLLRTELLPTVVTDFTDSLSENLQKFSRNAILNFVDGAKGKGGKFTNFIGRLFGLSAGSRAQSKDPYIKGEVPFDGKAHKAIVDVIPNYLARILNVVTSIKTGKVLSDNNNMIYDYETGKFQKEGVIRQNIIDQKDDRYARNYIDIIRSGSKAEMDAFYDSLSKEDKAKVDAYRKLEEEEKQKEKNDGKFNIDTIKGIKKKLTLEDVKEQQKNERIKREYQQLMSGFEQNTTNKWARTIRMFNEYGIDIEHPEYNDAEKLRIAQQNKEFRDLFIPDKTGDSYVNQIRNYILNDKTHLMQYREGRSSDFESRELGMSHEDEGPSSAIMVDRSTYGYTDKDIYQGNNIIGPTNKSDIKKLNNELAKFSTGVEMKNEGDYIDDKGNKLLTFKEMRKRGDNIFLAAGKSFTQFLNYGMSDFFFSNKKGFFQNFKDNFKNKFNKVVDNIFSSDWVPDSVRSWWKKRKDKKALEETKEKLEQLKRDQEKVESLRKTNLTLEELKDLDAKSIEISEKQNELTKIQNELNEKLNITSEETAKATGSIEREGVEKGESIAVKDTHTARWVKNLVEHFTGEKYSGDPMDNKKVDQFGKKLHNKRNKKTKKQKTNKEIISEAEEKAEAQMEEAENAFTANRERIFKNNNLVYDKEDELSMKLRYADEDNLSDDGVMRRLIINPLNRLIRGYKNVPSEYSVKENSTKYNISKEAVQMLEQGKLDPANFKEYVDNRYNWLKSTHVYSKDDSLATTLYKAAYNRILDPLADKLIGDDKKDFLGKYSFPSILLKRFQLSVTDPIKRKLLGKDVEPEEDIDENSSFIKVLFRRVDKSILTPLSNVIFGDDSEDVADKPKTFGQKVKAKIDTLWDQYGDDVKGLGKGAGIGGLIGAAFGHPLIGAAVGMFTTTDTFKEVILGDKNPQSIKNLLKRALIGDNTDLTVASSFVDILKMRVDESILTPLKNFLIGKYDPKNKKFKDGLFTRMMQGINTWATKNKVAEKLQDSFTIISREIKYMAKSFASTLLKIGTSAIEKTFNFTNKVGNFILTKIFGNEKVKNNKLVKGIRGLVGKVAAAPINIIGNTKNRILAKQQARFAKTDENGNVLKDEDGNVLIDEDKAREAGMDHLIPTNADKFMKMMKSDKYMEWQGKLTGFSGISEDMRKKLLDSMSKEDRDLFLKKEEESNRIFKEISKNKSLKDKYQFDDKGNLIFDSQGKAKVNDNWVEANVTPGDSLIANTVRDTNAEVVNAIRDQGEKIISIITHKSPDEMTAMVDLNKEEIGIAETEKEKWNNIFKYNGFKTKEEADRFKALNEKRSLHEVNEDMFIKVKETLKANGGSDYEDAIISFLKEIVDNTKKIESNTAEDGSVSNGLSDDEVKELDKLKNRKVNNEITKKKNIEKVVGTYRKKKEDDELRNFENTSDEAKNSMWESLVTSANLNGTTVTSRIKQLGEIYGYNSPVVVYLTERARETYEERHDDKVISDYNQKKLVNKAVAKENKKNLKNKNKELSKEKKTEIAKLKESLNNGEITKKEYKRLVKSTKADYKTKKSELISDSGIELTGNESIDKQNMLEEKEKNNKEKKSLFSAVKDIASNSKAFVTVKNLISKTVDFFKNLGAIGKAIGKGIVKIGEFFGLSMKEIGKKVINKITSPFKTILYGKEYTELSPILKDYYDQMVDSGKMTQEEAAGNYAKAMLNLKNSGGLNGMLNKFKNKISNKIKNTKLIKGINKFVSPLSEEEKNDMREYVNWLAKTGDLSPEDAAIEYARQVKEATKYKRTDMIKNLKNKIKNSSLVQKVNKFVNPISEEEKIEIMDYINKQVEKGNISPDDAAIEYSRTIKRISKSRRNNLFNVAKIKARQKIEDLKQKAKDKIDDAINAIKLKSAAKKAAKSQLTSAVSDAKEAATRTATDAAESAIELQGTTTKTAVDVATSVKDTQRSSLFSRIADKFHITNETGSSIIGGIMKVVGKLPLVGKIAAAVLGAGAIAGITALGVKKLKSLSSGEPEETDDSSAMNSIIGKANKSANSAEQKESLGTKLVSGIKKVGTGIKNFVVGGEDDSKIIREFRTNASKITDKDELKSYYNETKSEVKGLANKGILSGYYYTFRRVLTAKNIGSKLIGTKEDINVLAEFKTNASKITDLDELKSYYDETKGEVKGLVHKGHLSSYYHMYRRKIKLKNLATSVVNGVKKAVTEVVDTVKLFNDEAKKATTKEELENIYLTSIQNAQTLKEKIAIEAAYKVQKGKLTINSIKNSVKNIFNKTAKAVKDVSNALKTFNEESRKATTKEELKELYDVSMENATSSDEKLAIKFAYASAKARLTTNKIKNAAKNLFGKVADFGTKVVDKVKDIAGSVIGQEKDGLIWNGTKWVAKAAIGIGTRIGNLVWDGISFKNADTVLANQKSNEWWEKLFNDGKTQKDSSEPKSFADTLKDSFNNAKNDAANLVGTAAGWISGGWEAVKSLVTGDSNEESTATPTTTNEDAVAASTAARENAKVLAEALNESVNNTELFTQILEYLKNTSDRSSDIATRAQEILTEIKNSSVNNSSTTVKETNTNTASTKVVDRSNIITGANKGISTANNFPFRESTTAIASGI